MPQPVAPAQIPPLDLERVRRGDNFAVADALHTLWLASQQHATARTVDRSKFVWQNVPFDASNFFSLGGPTWTVTANDFSAQTFVLIDQVLIYAISLDAGTTTTGSPTALNVKLPRGLLVQAADIDTSYIGSAFEGISGDLLTCVASSNPGFNERVTVRRPATAAFAATLGVIFISITVRVGYA